MPDFQSVRSEGNSGLFQMTVHMQISPIFAHTWLFPTATWSGHIHPWLQWKAIRAYTPSRIWSADVSALCSPSAHAPSAESSQSTKLPAWQQNTSTDKAFYYFYSTLFPPQLWRRGSPTLRDAPTRSAAVSFYSPWRRGEIFQGCVFSPHPDS